MPESWFWHACRGTLARSWSWNNTGKLTHWLPEFLKRLGLQPRAVLELPIWQTGSAAKGVEDLETGEELLVIGGRNKDLLQTQLPTIAAARNFNKNDGTPRLAAQ